MSDLYGQGLAMPLAVTPSGRLAMSAGDDRILDSIEAILDTPLGTCPMDPRYGVDLDAYDPVSQPEQTAWRVAGAIDRSEPRIGDLEVAIIDVDPSKGMLVLDIRVTPIGSNTRLNRVFPLYTKA